MRWEQRQGVVRFWDWRNGREALPSITTPSEPIDVGFLDDDRAVVVCGGGHIVLVDLSNHQILSTHGHGGTQRTNGQSERMVAISPDRHQFVTFGLGAKALVWDSKTLKVTGVLSHQNRIRSVTFGPEGKLIATGSRDCTARVWEAATCEPLSEPLEHTDWVFQCRFNKQGHLLTASRDHCAHLWDWRAAKRICPPFQHGNEVFAADFVPDTPFIITCSNDQTARFWEVHSGKPVSPPIRISGYGRRIQVSPKQRTIFVCARFIYALDYSDLTESETETSPDSFESLAELKSARKIGESLGVVNLTSKDWMDRWKCYRSSIREPD